jgi:hypothetical protein
LATIATAAGLVPLVVGVVRSFQMARVFVNRIYRSRAYLATVLMLTIIMITPFSYLSVPDTAIGNLLGILPLFALLLALLAFVDRGIKVAMEGDFFHRDILHWRALSRYAYAALLISLVVASVSLFSVGGSDTSPLPDVVGVYQLLVVNTVVFGYSVVALVIGGRRTPDQIMKRHIRLLGYGLIFFVISFPFFSGSPIENLAANVVIIFANLFLYLSVMSLSDVGRVGRLEIPAPAQVAVASSRR